ncbi:MAG: DUF2177 family protein [Dehalogenimonas sp.]
MSFIKVASLYAVTFVVFFGIDLLWLGVIARSFYREQLAGLLRGQFDILPAIVFYLIYTVGLMVFVIMPALNNNSLIQALTLGILFGLVAYATYDLSNLATLKNWPVKVVFADIFWGMAISGIVAIVSYIIGNAIK